MSSWPFGRKILATFLALALLIIGMAAGSLLSIRSLVTAEGSIASVDGINMGQASELSLHHQERVSALRGFLLSRDRSFLVTEKNATSEFDRVLDSLIRANPSYTAISPLLQRIRSYEADYTRLIQRAIKEPGKATWILDTLVKPRRLDLERSILELNRHFSERLEASNQAFMSDARHSMRAIAGMLGGTLLVLAGLGLLLNRIVEDEQQTLTQAKRARDTLQQAERRAALLAKTGKVVTETPDPKAALPQVAELAVDWLSNVCLIELTEGSGVLKPAAIAVSEDERGPLLKALHRDLPQGLGAMFTTSQILQSGRPIAASSVEDPRLIALGITSFMAVPLRARNRALGVLLLFRTDHRETYEEEGLLLAEEISHQIALAIDNARLLQQAEEGLRMREELLSTVAHDLKNPLTSIRMSSEMLLNPRTATGASVEKLAATIQESTQSMEQLIHDLLDLTKIESGRIALDRRPNDADSLIGDCLKILKSQAEIRGVELSKDVRPGECIADCDRNRVVQVLSNLIGNAIKFTGKGGRVRVEAQATGEGIRFSVIDNGPGIPSDELPHVFDRYWQAHRTGKGSAGLGLSIARGIVEAHGGRIWVESALHIGSRFFFTLPEARKQTQRRAA